MAAACNFWFHKTKRKWCPFFLLVVAALMPSAFIGRCNGNRIGTKYDNGHTLKLGRLKPTGALLVSLCASLNETGLFKHHKPVVL